MASYASVVATGVQSRKVVFFPEGPGHIFVRILHQTPSSKVFLVRSLADGRLLVRKESLPQAYDYQKAYQSDDVENVMRLQDVSGLPRLVGWVEYMNETYTSVVVVSYWELCNAGTLHDLQQKLAKDRRNAAEKIPLQCISSTFVQMLRRVIDTIRAGVVHNDAHGRNWFIHITDDALIPQMVLGDWGLGQAKPTEPSFHGSVQSWWNATYITFTGFIVRLIRGLLLQGATPTGSLRAYFDRLVEGTEPWKSNLKSLIKFLNQIEDLRPGNCASGEQWLSRLETIYIEARDVLVPPISSAASPSHRCLVINHSPIPAAYEEVISALSNVDWDALIYGASRNGLVHVWKVAHINTKTGNIMSVADRPKEFKHHNHIDQTNMTLLPQTWAQAHQATKAKLRASLLEDVVVEEQGTFGMQSTQNQPGTHDTAF